MFYQYFDFSLILQLKVLIHTTTMIRTKNWCLDGNFTCTLLRLVPQRDSCHWHGLSPALAVERVEHATQGTAGGERTSPQDRGLQHRYMCENRGLALGRKIILKTEKLIILV